MRLPHVLALFGSTIVGGFASVPDPSQAGAADSLEPCQKVCGKAIPLSCGTHSGIPSEQTGYSEVCGNVPKFKRSNPSSLSSDVTSSGISDGPTTIVTSKSSAADSTSRTIPSSLTSAHSSITSELHLSIASVTTTGNSGGSGGKSSLPSSSLESLESSLDATSSDDNTDSQDPTSSDEATSSQDLTSSDEVPSSTPTASDDANSSPDLTFSDGVTSFPDPTPAADEPSPDASSFPIFTNGDPTPPSSNDIGSLQSSGPGPGDISPTPVLTGSSNSHKNISILSLTSSTDIPSQSTSRYTNNSTSNSSVISSSISNGIKESTIFSFKNSSAPGTHLLSSKSPMTSRMSESVIVIHSGTESSNSALPVQSSDKKTSVSTKKSMMGHSDSSNPSTVSGSQAQIPTGLVLFPDPAIDDPACVPNDCVSECFLWRVTTFALFKRPVCPCIPTVCSKDGEHHDDNDEKKCSMFGCGCGWMGLGYGPGCDSQGFAFDLPKFGFPCGLFGCNPCDFFGCAGEDQKDGILGYEGHCLIEGGCPPCPSEICSGPSCTISGGCGPLPGPPPTPPADRPQTCDESEKTRVTERFVWCTEGLAVSDLPSTIGGTSTTMNSTLCVPLVQATMKVCPGAMAGYTTTTTKTVISTISDQAAVCTVAPLSLDDDEGDNVPANVLLPTSFKIRSNTSRTGHMTPVPFTFISISAFSSETMTLTTDSNPKSRATKSVATKSVATKSIATKSVATKSVATKSGKTSTSSSQPAQSLGPMDRYGNWRVEILHKMQGVSSNFNWTLYDPNNAEAGRGGTGGDRLTAMVEYIESKERKEEHSMLFKVNVTVTDPTDADKARVNFVMDKWVPNCNSVYCKPSMTTEDKTENNYFQVESCETKCQGTKLHQSDFWCNDLNDGMWITDGSSNWRQFWCGWVGY